MKEENKSWDNYVKLEPTKLLSVDMENLKNIFSQL